MARPLSRRTVTFRCLSRQWAKFAVLARKQGKTPSALLREVIDRALPIPDVEEQDVVDAAQDGTMLVRK